MYYLLLYDVVDDYIQGRAQYREVHLSLVRRARGRGELLMAGAFADPVDGAALLFKTDDASVPEAFANNDPYVKAGLVTAWRVRKWMDVIGSL